MAVDHKPYLRTEQIAGWIDTKGHIYKCRAGRHIDFPASIGLEEYQLEERGWIKFCTRDRKFMIIGIPTQGQIDSCFDIAKKYDMMNQFNKLNEY